MNSTIRREFKEGILLVDKPIGNSTFKIVTQVRRLTGVRKVGHAGTLDPLASGLVIVLVGKNYTTRADKFLKLDKEYEVELKLGLASTTDDAEGQLSKISAQVPSRQKLAQALNTFIGVTSQTPPQHSAIKIAGRRAYALARRGEKVALAPRPVTIYSINSVEYIYPKVSFTTAVSSGTYIRSLARDIGDKLGTGAYVTKLRRTKIGEYDIKDAVSLD